MEKLNESSYEIIAHRHIDRKMLTKNKSYSNILLFEEGLDGWMDGWCKDSLHIKKLKERRILK
jgi:hypothetical protein